MKKKKNFIIFKGLPLTQIKKLENKIPTYLQQYFYGKVKQKRILNYSLTENYLLSNYRDIYLATI